MATAEARQIYTWRPVTTAFVRRWDKRLIVVKRSEKVSTYRGMWGGVSGGVEGEELLVHRAATEVLEEVGIAREALRLAVCGRPLPVIDGHPHFLVHPFLFDLAPGAADTVTLNWENTDSRWVTVDELAQLPTVPLLLETLQRLVLPTEQQQHVDYLTRDRDHGAAQLAAYVVHAFAQLLQQPGIHSLRVAGEEAAGAAAAGAGVVAGGASGEGMTGAAMLESLRDFGFHMATCRPSMAAIANAAAGVLAKVDEELQQQGAMEGPAGPEGSGAANGTLPTVEAVRAALYAATEAEAARLESLAAACSTKAAELLQPCSTVLTTSLSSAVVSTLVKASASTAALAADSNTSSHAASTPARKGLKVIVCESRPLCEGVIMAQRLAAAGMEVTLITDAQAGVFMREADAIVLGSDALLAAGAVNKVGSSLLALAAQANEVPVYVVSHSLKLCPGSVLASCLPRMVGCQEEQEEQGWEELIGAWQQLKGGLQRAMHGFRAADSSAGSTAANEGRAERPPGEAAAAGREGSITVRNIYFEVVPWDLVAALMTEDGEMAPGRVGEAVELQREHYMKAFNLVRY